MSKQSHNMNIAHLYSIKKNFNNAVSVLKAALLLLEKG